ncbi:hypothetical protein [Xenorhabdus sp. KJ12.1]|uniref:hypothetical protein n=1 Tax=Xenorhabdus sp. KJ12.1 TaxID=1851571 RepID=UPI000C038B23|nr:hypothetical protein [Xenorhabdus sp. KJ12.1]PHM68052.1 lipoprotein [Xenorhabdus sp. KJ12.1]
MTQKEAEKLVSLLNQIKSSDNPNIYDKLWEEINQVTIDLSTIYGKYSANDTVEENKYYGEFLTKSISYRDLGYSLNSSSH